MMKWGDNCSVHWKYLGYNVINIKIRDKTDIYSMID